MKSWKMRLALLFVLSAMLSVVSAPAMAQVFDDVDVFGDPEICYEIDGYWSDGYWIDGFLVCDGDLYVEADDFLDAEIDAAEAEAEAEAEEAEADAEEDEEDDGVFDD